jgi:hypothetical protein
VAFDIRIGRRKRRYIARDAVVPLSSEPKKKNGGRGVFVGKILEKQIIQNNNQRIPLRWNYEKKIIHCEFSNRVADAIGSIVRENIPMTKLCYFDHDADVFKIVIDRLSTYYQFDWGKDDSLYNHIQESASKMYRKWINECKDAFEFQESRLPVPINFIHRPNEWYFLCDHFETEEFKAKSKKMQDARLKGQRVEHRSGPIPFLVRSAKNAEEGHIAPFVKTLVDVTCSRDVADRGQALIDEAMAEQENEILISDGTTDTAQSSTMEQLPLDRQILMIETMRGRGKSVGTVIHGMGSQSMRDEQRRGPAKGTPRPKSIAEEEMVETQKKQETELMELKQQVSNQNKVIAQMAEAFKAAGINFNFEFPSSS